MTADRDLQQSVLDALSWEPSIVAAHIGVTAQGGVVTLTGYVDTYVEKWQAERATLRVKGVRAVAEELEVRLAMDCQRSDDDIAAAVIERLAWDTALPRNAIEVQVESGWVTLSGDVAGYYQREAATLAVRPLRGVVGISNQITIRPDVNVTNLSDDIVHALHRSWFLDPKTIRVSADRGGAIRLSGSVHSWPERQVAAEIAWAAPGATAVTNDLAVV
jgi:osmotically-inducible protein OsmY